MIVYTSNLYQDFNRVAISLVTNGQSLISTFSRAISHLKNCVAREVSLALKHFAKSERIKSLHHLFQDCIAYLNGANKKILKDQAFELLEVEFTEYHPLSEQEINSLSLLKNKRNRDFVVPKDALTPFFCYDRHKPHEVNAIFSCLGEFAKKNFGVNPLSLPVQYSFSEGTYRKEALERKITEYDNQENIDSEMQSKFVSGEAERLSQEIKNLKEDKPFIYFGELKSKQGLLPGFLEETFKQNLPQGFYQFLQGDNKVLSARLKKYVFDALAEKGLLNEEQNNTKFEGEITRILAQVDTALKNRLPLTWYENIVSNLRKDIEESGLGVQEDPQKLADQLWKAMREEGFLKVIDEAIDTTLSGSQYLIQQQLENVKDKINSTLPESIMQLMPLLGVNLGHGERYCFEIKKQSDSDKYCLTFYCNSLNSTIHPVYKFGEKKGAHFPLVFKNIDPSKLNQNFFEALIIYQAWPQWGVGQDFTLDHLVENLLGSLDSKPLLPTSKTIYPETASFKGNPIDWLKGYMHNYLVNNLQVGQNHDFKKIYSYDLPLQLLINFWPEVEMHPELISQSSVRYALQRVVDQLSKEGVSLAESNKLSPQELKALYATLKQVNRALKRDEQKILPGSKISSVVIPKELHSIVKEMTAKLMITPSHIETLKEVFVEVMGDDFEESFDLILKEILPEISHQQAITLPNCERSWEEILNLDNVKKFVDDVSKTRFSLLHLFRCYARISSVLSLLINITTRSYFVVSFLSAYCPQIGQYMPLRRAVQLASYYGPSVLKTTLPEKLYKSFDMIFGLTGEVMKYIFLRIASHILRVMVQSLLNREKIESFKSSLKSLQGEFLQEGELSYDVPHYLPAERLVVKAPSDSTRNENQIIESKKQEIFSYPRPYDFKVTSNNLDSFFDQLERDLKQVQKKGGARQAMVFMHSQLRQLPILGQEHGEIWNEVKDPEKVIERLHQCLSDMNGIYNRDKVIKYSPDETAENITSIFTIYAIIDTLARRCPEAYLTGEMKPNGVNLAKWMGDPASKVSNPKTYAKIVHLSCYFDLIPFKEYTEKELLTYQKGRLFQFDNDEFLSRSQIENDEDGYQYLNICGLLDTADGAYFRSLLEDENVQKRLKFLGVTKDTPEDQKLALLFQNPSLEPPLSFIEKGKESQKPVEKPIEEDWSFCDSGMRLLPQPFYHLRAAHLFANQYILSKDCSVILFDETDIEMFTYDYVDDEKLGHHLKDANKYKEKHLKIDAPVLPKNNIWKKSYAWVKKALHTSTSEIYKKYLFNSGMQFESSYDRQNTLEARKLRYHRGANPFIKYDFGVSVDEIKIKLNLPKRSQSEIMVKSPISDTYSLTTEEKAILEMVNSHSSDQILRCLSYFTLAKEKLQDPYYRSTFDIFISGIQALNLQLGENPKIVKELGCFFHEKLNEFHKEKDFETCLYLSKVGVDILHHCERHLPKARKYFPDFPQFIEDKIANEYRQKSPQERKLKKICDGLILSYLHIASSYRYLDPKTLSEEKRQEIVKLLARLKYCRSNFDWQNKPWDVAIKSSETLYLWETYIDEMMSKDSYLRQQILSGILQDAGVDSEKIEGSWSGEFPKFAKGQLLVDLNYKGELPIKNSIENDLSENAVLRKIQNNIMRYTGTKVTVCWKTSPTTYAFPNEGIEVTIFKGTTVVKNIYKIFEGKKWRYLYNTDIDKINFNLPKDQHLFIETESETPTVLQIEGDQVICRHQMQLMKSDTPPVLQMEGDQEVCHPQMPRKDNHFVSIHTDGFLHYDLPPESRGEGFSLFKWFQPPSAIKLKVFSTEESTKLGEICFSDVNLNFKVQTVDGVEQAVCSDGKTPGFYIAKRQRDDRLLAYPQRLVLENEAGDKKVHLAATPFKQLLGFSLIKQFGKIPTSPLIENAIKNMLDKNLASNSPSLFTYSFNDQGKLESSDPQAIFYLVAYHYSRGEFAQALSYLTQLEDLARGNSLSPKFIESLNEMTLLFLMDTPEAEEIFLRLVALRGENTLLHYSEEKGISNDMILRWVVTQMKYDRYLKRIKKGAYPNLSQSQEIFIMKSIVAMNSRLISERAKKSPKILCGKISGYLEHFLMMPTIIDRYNKLKKFDEGFSLFSKVEDLFLHAINGEKNQSFKIPSFNDLMNRWNVNNGQDQSLLAALISFYEQNNNCPQTETYPWCKIIFSPAKTSSRLPDLTPDNIRQHFLYFYRLASQQIPEKPGIIDGDSLPTKGWLRSNSNRRQGVRSSGKRFTVNKKKMGTGLIAWRSRCLKNKEIINNRNVENDKDSFLEQAKGFHLAFPLLKGSIKDPLVKEMASILQMVMEEKNQDYPEPDELENLFKGKQKEFDQKMSELSERANSWGRWLKKISKPHQVKSNEAMNNLQWQCAATFTSNFGDNILKPLFWCRSAINFGLQLRHSWKHVSEKNLKIHEEIIEKEKLLSEANNTYKNLSDECEKAMMQRESAIDKTMKEIFDEYFEEDRTHLNNREKPIKKFDKIDLSIYKEFPDLQQSLEDYYNRDTSDKSIVKLKKGKNINSLWNKLVRLRNEVDQFLSKERQYAKDFVRSQLFANQDLISKIRGDKIPQVSFKEIDNLFIQENDKELIERFKIPSEKLPHLKQRLYLYHVMASRWNLLFEKMAELKEPKDKAIPMIAEELQRRRVYDFKDVPERLVRGKLVFESRTGKMLWDKQSSQIDRMLLNPEDRQVVELIMGSGKSWYGIPEIGYFSGFVINIWPAAVSKTNIPLIFRQARKIFNQAASALQISRRIKWVRDNSWALYQIFQRALHQREQINMTKEDLQSSELCYIEKGIAFAKNKAVGLREVGENFWKVLKRVRYDSRGCIDEAHKQFDRRKELNYPLGAKKRLEIKYVEVMTKALYELVSDHEFSKILTIKSEKPSPLTEKQYKDIIQKKLAEKLAESFDFSGQELAEVIVYLCGQAESIPKGVLENKKFQEIALVKGLLTVFIPEALERTIHVDFNPSKKGNGEYVRPSEGNDNPLEESIIQSPFEAYVKTAFQLLHDRLKDEQMQKLIDDLKKKAKVRAGRGDPEITLEALFFQEQCPGYKLFSIEDKDLAEVYKIFRKSDQAVLLYLKNFIAKDIRYSERRLSSNSSNFGSMFRKFYSDTGTPYNKGSYLPGTKVLHDKGTDGESVHMMSRQSEPTRILKNEAPRQVLEELIEFCHGDKMIRAIIDRGAVLNGISSDDVAKRLLEYITKYRPEMKGVTFYRDGELMMLERGASKAIPAHLSKISEEERLTYFPEPQTYAADVSQVKGAKGIITVASTTCSNEWFQAGYRMRGLDKKNQKLIPVMTERTRQSIVKDERIPNIHEINLFTKGNEERQQRQDNYQADRQKMHDVVRRAILDKSLEAKNFEKAAAILAKFEDFLITKVQDDPFILFGHIDIQVEPEKIFDLLRERYMTMIKKEKLFSKQDQEKIQKELNEIGRGKYPDKVHSYKVEEELEVDKLDEINKQAQLQSDDEEEVEQENQVENEHQQQAQRLQSDQKPKGKVQDSFAWPEKLNPTSLDWLELSSSASKKDNSLYLGNWTSKKTVSFHSLSEVLGSSKNKEGQQISKKIYPRIIASRNVLYRQSENEPLEAFGPFQIPIFEILVIKKGTEEPSFVIIDENEAEYWRKKLEEDSEGKYDTDPSVKIGLYDVTNKILRTQGINKFRKDELEATTLKRAIIHIKFLRGDVRYKEDEIEILQHWLEKNPEAMSYFHRVHQYHAITPLEGSDLYRVIKKFDKNLQNNWVKI